MKKSMIAIAATALCGAVFATGDVSSGNIVGYQIIEIPVGYSLFTMTFKDIAGGQYDIQDVKVLASDGTDYEVNNRVKVNKLAANGNYEATYNYRLSKGGWCSSATFLGRNVVMFGDGEGLCVYNGDSSALKLQVSGSVNLTPVSMEIASTSYRIIGNMTPVAVDIQDVIPYIGSEICSANNRVKINKILANGNYGPTYNYRLSKGGWCQSATFIGRDAVTLAPGESLCVYNGESDAITLRFPSPID